VGSCEGGGRLWATSARRFGAASNAKLFYSILFTPFPISEEIFRRHARPPKKVTVKRGSVV